MLNSDESKDALAIRVGGNFEPVIAACQYDWMECPFALASYIWFEVVTDVADSLANETILWRILAVLLIFTTIAHLMYWKIRWMRELNTSNENLKLTNSRVQDLELKVNILTYKVQYGTWPLPHFAEKGSASNLREINSVLSKLNNENSWIKHLLTKARRKNYNNELFYNVHSQLTVNNSNIETKYLSSNYEDISLQNSLQRTISVDEKSSQTNYTKKNVIDAHTECHLEKKENLNNDISILNVSELITDNNNVGSYRVSSDNNLSKGIFVNKKKNVENNIVAAISQPELDFSDNLPVSKVISNIKFTGDELKLVPSTTNIISLSSTLKVEDKVDCLSNSDDEFNKNSHETLFKVKERLENLHSTLRNYSSKESELDLLNTNQNEDSSNINKNCKTDSLCSVKKYLDDNQNGYNYETSIDSQNSINIQDSSIVNTPCSTYKTIIMNGQLPDEYIGNATNEEYLTIDDVSENNQKEDIEITQETENSNTFALADELKNYKNEVDKNSSENNALKTENYWTEIDDTNCLTKCSPENLTSESNEIIPSKKSSLVQISAESDSPDDQSTSELLQKASALQKELLLKIESNIDTSDNNIQNESQQNDFYNYLGWNNETHFQPKALDMITEESSGSISTDKNSRSCIPKTPEKYKNSEEDNFQQDSKNESVSLSNYCIDTEEPENKITIEHKEINKMNVLINENKTTSITLQVENASLEVDSSKDVSNMNESNLPTELKTNAEVCKDNVTKNFGFSDLNADLNLGHLTESSSDTSVNRLIDRLIESERKSKSAKSLLNTKSDKELAEESLNNLIDSNPFLASTHSENEECDDFSVESNTEKSRHFEKEKVTKFNSEINNENCSRSEIISSKETEIDSPKSMGTVINLNNSVFEEAIIAEKENSINKDLSNNETLNLQDTCLKKIDSIAEINVKNFIIKGSEDYTFKEEEQNCETLDTALFECGEIKILDKNTNESKQHNEVKEDGSITELNTFNYIEQGSDIEKDISKSKKYVNFSVSDGDTLSAAQNSLNQLIISDPEIIDNCKITNKKDAGDFRDDNLSFVQEFQQKEEIPNKIINETSKNVGKNTLHSGDSNISRVASNSTLNNPKKSKSNTYHASCKTPNSFHLSLGLRKTEFNASKNNKNTNSRQSIKSSFELNNNNQLKAKSNLNLASSEKSSPLPSHRRSKSFVTPRDISLRTNNNKVERKNSTCSLALSSRSPSKLSTPREPLVYDWNKKFESKRENSFESLEISSRSSSKSCTYIPPKGVATDEKDKFKMKRNNSNKSLVLSSRSSSKSHIPISPRDSFNQESSKGDVKRKFSSESLMLSSKSFIPVLKNRLEAARRNVGDSRTKSPVRGPLTMAVGKCRIDAKKECKKDGGDKSFNKSIEDKKIKSSHPNNTFEMQYTNDSKKDVIFLNANIENNQIITKVLSPKELMEYISDKEFKVQSITSIEQNSSITENNQSITSSKQDSGIIPPLPDNTLSDVSSLNSYVFQIQNSPPKSCSFKIDNKETEILVMPKTVETSTSISDLRYIPNIMESKKNAFKIFDVPEELTKEEYISLLQMINENPDLEHLPSMDKLCSKLSTNNQRK